eukprot:scaffold2255_cov293-Chaetoceros_neogracile.AAC.6
MTLRLIISCAVAAASLSSVHSWTSIPYPRSSTRHILSKSIPRSTSPSSSASSSSSTTSHKKQLHPLHATQQHDSQTDLEDTTEKYGLEAGLFESLKKKDGAVSAKSLLKKYGVAYLATSIPLALLSFSVCYFLVDSGIDVSALLSKVGIDATLGGTEDKIGTFAIAYTAHKAASPIRFPPTVLLTPVMAKLIGKEVNEEEDEVEKN